MKYDVKFYTEEYVNKDEIIIILCKLGYSKRNFRDIKIILVSSFDKTSFVDGVCEILNSAGKIIDKLCIEITQTTDKESRNTSVYQRLIKFLFVKIYLPDYRRIMYFKENFVGNTNTSKIGLSMLNLMDVEIINASIDKYLNLSELINLKNKISKTNSSNVPLYVKLNEKNVELSGKLKNGNNWSDPNIGFLSSIMFLLKNEGYHNFKIVNHHMSHSKLNKTNNKFRKLISTFDVTLHFDLTDIIWSSNDEFIPSNEYFKILNEGEKLSMINFLNSLINKGYDVYFTNIAGCERGKLKIGKQIHTIPKKMRIPDLVVGKNGNLYFIEGECKKNINKGLKQLTTFNEFIKFICADLPYGQTEIKWDVRLDMSKLWDDWWRVLKPNGVIALYGVQPFTSYLVTSQDKYFKYSLVWKKSRVGGFAQAPYRFLNTHEDILIFSKAGMAKNSKNLILYNPQGVIEINKEVKGKGSNNLRNNRKKQNNYIQKFTNYPQSILEFSSEHNPVHPTQKPLKLNQFLIKTFSNENDFVLDPCFGSGSFINAAINCGRKYVGFENCENYFNRFINDTTI